MGAQSPTNSVGQCLTSSSSGQKFKSKKYMFKPIYTHPQWESFIKGILKDIIDHRKSIRQIIQLLNYFRKKISPQRTNPKKSSFEPKQYRFQMLRKLYREQQLLELFGDIAYIICKTKSINVPIFTLSQKKIDKSIPKKQIFYIICCMFMCLVPQQEFDQTNQVTKYNHLTHFSIILSDCQFKTKSIVQYIRLEIDNMIYLKSFQNLSIVRKYTRATAKEIIYELEKNKIMTQLKIISDNCDIQSYFGDIKISFANKLLGGGALKNGSVQEEIMIACHPQMYAAMILCSSMNDSQALCFRGFKKYFKMQGYKDSVVFRGQQIHKYQINENNQASQFIVSIDAMDFDRQEQKQYQEASIDRQIVKAYTGFSCMEDNKKIITGNWGCGVFKGDIQLKLIIQWIAASLAGKNVIYCPYGQERNVFHKRLDSMKGKRITDIYYDLICSAKTYKQKIKQSRGSRLSRGRGIKFFDDFFG